MNPTNEFLEELACALDYWVNKLTDSIQEDADLSWTEHPEAFHQLRELIHSDEALNAYRKVLNEGIRGYAHNILVALDGGTKLADRVRITLIDDKGQPLNAGLHERFIDHLLDTNRL